MKKSERNDGYQPSEKQERGYQPNKKTGKPESGYQPTKNEGDHPSNPPKKP